MDYFDRKAIDFLDSHLGGPQHYSGEDVDKVALAFKEVARDQRHACAEAVQNNHGIYDREATDRAAAVAMNATIRRETAEQ